MQALRTSSETQSTAIAREIAEKLPQNGVLLLSGALGAGKSVIAREIIRHLLEDPALEVPSPTFTLVQYYEKNSIKIRHFDLYRLEDPEDIFELGWEEALESGLCLVEWPERLGAFLPKKAATLRIEVDGKQRIMTFDPGEYA